jgi:DNA processing protein
VDPVRTSGGAIRHLTPSESGFPPELRAIPQPPVELFLVGELPPPPRVAVVGSRDADDYGLELSGRLGRELAAAGVCVVSGGAGGVDTAALEGCLTAGGRPIAVLGTGVDVAYPTGNQALFDRIAGAGGLLSEYPPGTPGRPEHFPKRNRLVSGLSSGVVVVRAARSSGSLITAREAARQGRTVCAVPGPAGHPLSAGVHDLLRRGARLVETSGDVLEALSIRGSQRSLVLPEPAASLSPEEQQILSALGEAACPIDSVCARTGLPSARVSALLLGMELRGLVVQKPGMRYLRGPAVGVGG